MLRHSCTVCTLCEHNLFCAVCFLQQSSVVSVWEGPYGLLNTQQADVWIHQAVSCFVCLLVESGGAEISHVLMHQGDSWGSIVVACSCLHCHVSVWYIDCDTYTDILLRLHVVYRISEWLVKDLQKRVYVVQWGPTTWLRRCKQNG